MLRLSSLFQLVRVSSYDSSLISYEWVSPNDSIEIFGVGDKEGVVSPVHSSSLLLSDRTVFLLSLGIWSVCFVVYKRYYLFCKYTVNVLFRIFLFDILPFGSGFSRFSLSIRFETPLSQCFPHFRFGHRCLSISGPMTRISLGDLLVFSNILEAWCGNLYSRLSRSSSYKVSWSSF